jgi:uncharacterized membrane protein YfcA
MIFKIGLLLIGTLIAFWISAICGGGASLILIPILNLLLPTTVVPFSLTVGTLTSSASRIVFFKQYINWKIFWWFVPFSIPAVLLGGWLIKYINPIYLQFFIALFLLANIPQLFIKKRKKEFNPNKQPKYTLALVGICAGFVSGITGAVGLLFNRFYLKHGLSKEEIVATRAANEVFLHLIKLGIYIALGLYSPMAIILGITIAIASIISSYTVKFILPKISDFRFKQIGYGAMAISGMVLMFSTTQKIFSQDRIRLSTATQGSESETTIQWRNSDLVLEYSFGDGIEVERPILYKDLPPHLLQKYQEMLPNYDTILLEKVYKLGAPISYEFYAFKGKQCDKFEWE